VQIGRPDGSQGIVDVRVALLPDQSLLYSANDVTEIRARERREEQLKTQLIESQKTENIGRLAGGIAHDFNNIVAAIRSFALLAADEVVPDSDASRYVARIATTCDRAADLIKQILLFSRASKAELVPLNAHEVIEEVATYIGASMPASIGVKVFPLTVPMSVVGNAGQLVQVFMNLGLNARDAIGERRGRIEIVSSLKTITSVDATHLRPGLSLAKNHRTDGVVIHQYVVGAPLVDKDYLCVTVRDNGPGMSGQTLERIFEPFFTTKEKARGTGLGLPVVAAVAIAHQGFIVVTTQQNHGSRFNVYLPITKETVTAKKKNQTNRSKYAGTERVLVVDDEIDLADATSISLCKLGYEAVAIYYPKDALEIFTEDPNAWDVIITDQVMPELKGLELMERIRALRADIPVILCTGFSDLATEDNVMAAGAAAFFNKPVDAEILAQAIRMVCGTKEENPREF
jgi:two-component system, cell cycle sensor histidine kinase and response regulator CckA